MTTVLHIFSGVLSIAIMALFMISPIAAIVYAADALETTQQVSSEKRSLGMDLTLNSSYNEKSEAKKTRHLKAPDHGVDKDSTTKD